ncbi:MAG: hypothetical protein IZT60_06195 [Gammaproteobacteria bacterium]|nr:hypothetical protein [Gammaproteobacteria bacterium]
MKIKSGFFTATVVILLMASSHVAAAADSLFSYVPEDTIYFFANSKPLPADFYDEQMRQAEQVLAIAIHQMETAQKTAADNKKGKGSAAGTLTADLGSSQAGKFIRELMLEVLQNAESGKLANIGLSRDSRSMIYGIGLTPVMRVEIENPDAVMAMLKRVEQRTGFKLKFNSCDGLDCLVVADDKGQVGVALVIHNDHLAASLFQNAYRDKVLQHLTGKNKPEKSYSASQFRQFVESNHYSGYGEGFFKLQQGVENLQNVATAALKQQGEGGDIDQVQKCFEVAKAVVAHAPEVVMGVKSIQGRTINMEVVLKTTPEISKSLMAIPAPLKTFEVSADPMVDFGFSANVPKLRDSLLSFMAFLGATGEKAGCKAIRKKAMDEASMGIAMAMGMGITQVKTLYVAIDELKLGKKSQPENASARFSLIADDPMGLVRMLSMFAPPLATIQVPDDGASVPLPDGLLPTGIPPVSISLKEKNLNIVMGEKAASTTMDASKPAFFWFTSDGPRYYSIFAQLMESAPPSEEMTPQEQKQAIEMMRLMGQYQPWMSQMMYPDERGIVMDITVRYP